MHYYSEKMNRWVELDDRLAEICFNIDEHGERRMNLAFDMATIEECGHRPTKEELSDERLSYLCNQVLLSEIQLIHDLPKILQCIQVNYDKFDEAAKTGELLDIDIEMGD